MPGLHEIFPEAGPKFFSDYHGTGAGKHPCICSSPTEGCGPTGADVCFAAKRFARLD